MEVNELEYNTQIPPMPLPEYGRNIQRMVDYAMTLEDKEERTRCAQAIIQIMGNLFPHLRDVSDFKHKLWDHLAIMSDFKLDIDYPCEPVRRDNLLTKPEKVPYESHRIKVRHYGFLAEALIDEAVKMEEGEEKTELVRMIANHMKKSYYSMNHEIMEDKKVFDDLRELSGGKIDIKEEDMQLMDVRDVAQLSKNPVGKKNNRRK